MWKFRELLQTGLDLGAQGGETPLKCLCEYQLSKDSRKCNDLTQTMSDVLLRVARAMQLNQHVIQ